MNSTEFPFTQDTYPNKIKKTFVSFEFNEVIYKKKQFFLFFDCFIRIRICNRKNKSMLPNSKTRPDFFYFFDKYEIFFIFVETFLSMYFLF